MAATGRAPFPTSLLRPRVRSPTPPKAQTHTFHGYYEYKELPVVRHLHRLAAQTVLGRQFCAYAEGRP